MTQSSPGMCGKPRKFRKLPNFPRQVSGPLVAAGDDAEPVARPRPAAPALPTARSRRRRRRAADPPCTVAVVARVLAGQPGQHAVLEPAVGEAAEPGDRQRPARRSRPRPRPRRRSPGCSASKPHPPSPSTRSQVRISVRPTGAFSASASPRSSTSNAPSARRISPKLPRNISTRSVRPLPVDQPVPDLRAVVPAGGDVLFPTPPPRSARPSPGALSTLSPVAAWIALASMPLLAR